MINKLAPAFTLLDAYEKEHSLKDYKKSFVIVYFYPRDNTPGCTIEANEFTTLMKDFQKLNTVVLGISKDSCASHQKFIDKQQLKITLLSDPDHKVIEQFGAWQPKKFMGKEFLGIVRSTFLINPKGKIVFHWPKVSAKGHAQEVLEKLKEIQ